MTNDFPPAFARQYDSHLKVPLGSAKCHWGELKIQMFLTPLIARYAKAALPVVQAALTGVEPTGFMDRFFQAIVKIHWNNVTPGAYESLFSAVAKTFQANY